MNRGRTGSAAVLGLDIESAFRLALFATNPVEGCFFILTEQWIDSNEQEKR
jgi:hypothetical protein